MTGFGLASPRACARLLLNSLRLAALTLIAMLPVFGVLSALATSPASADGPAIVLATGGEITLSTQIFPDTTDYTENVFLAQPAPQVSLCSSCNQGPSPAPRLLGYEPAGTAIVLGMYIPNTGATLYSTDATGSNPGPGVSVTQQSATQWAVTFEEGGPQDIDTEGSEADIVVTVSETTGSGSGVPVGILASTLYGDQNNTTNMHYPCSSDPVNCATGNFIQSATDISVPGRGPNLNLTRTYNSLAASTPSPFGYGWSSSYSMSLALDPTCGCHATVTQENGSTATFNSDGSGNWAGAFGGEFATLTHNADGTWTFVRRARSIFTFSSTGQLVSEADLNHNTTSLSYNGSGQLSKVTDQAGRTITFAYGANGDVATATDPAGNVTHYGYGAAGDLTGVTDPTGAATTYGYDASHDLTTLTHPTGGVLTNTYNSLGQVTQQVDPLGRTTSFAYGPQETVITEPNGSTTDEAFNAQGELLTQTVAAGAAQSATTSYTYDPNTFSELSVTDPDNNTTSYTYDANGNLASTFDPTWENTSKTYNNLDEVLTSTSPLGVTTTYTYDGNGNLTSASTPLSDTSAQTTSWTYGDPAHPGDATATTDPDGHTTHAAYDTQGDLITSTDPLGDVTSATYNVLGQKVSSTTPDGNAPGANPSAYTTTYTYDALGRLLTSTDPLGHTTAKIYDGNGNTVKVTAPGGGVTHYAYDADDELLSTTTPNGTVSSNSYDAEGNLVAQKNADGQSNTYGYNLLNQKTSSTDALGHTTVSVYDAAGLLKSQTSPTNVTTTYTYDGDGRVVTIAYSDGTPGVENIYDSGGRLMQQTDASGSYEISYDQLNRLTQYLDGNNSNGVSYAYDAAGNLLTLSLTADPSVTYTYNAANQMASVNDGSGDTTSFSYDPSGNLTAIAHPDGSNDTYHLDTNGQITEVKATTPNATLYDLTTPRDANGNVTSQTASLPGSTSATTGYAYDANQELTATSVGTGSLSVPASGFSYDPAGNLTNLSVAGQGAQTNTYNAADELVSSTNPTNQGSTTYSYNTTDERTSETTSAAGQQLTSKFFWNGAGEMTGESGPAITAATGALGTTGSGGYTYNGLGLLASDSVGNISYNLVGATPQIVSDGLHEFIRGFGGLVVEQLTLGQAPLYYHHDQLGSTKALTGPNGHDLVNYTYSAYGLSTATATGVVNPIGFADSYTDPTTGLIYLLNRWYDPATAQFLSVDPILAYTGAAYSYAGDDPVNRVDPSGECACSGVHGIGSALEATGITVGYGLFGLLFGVGLVLAITAPFVVAGALLVSTAITSGVVVGSGLGILNALNANTALCNNQPLPDPLSP